MTESDKPVRKKRANSKKLRDQSIIQRAIQGETVTDIAKDMNLGRQTVSKIVNSDDAKSLAGDIDAKLQAGIDDAVRTVLDAVKVDYVAARDLLRNFASMKQNVDITHTNKIHHYATITKLDGTVIKLTSIEKEEEENEGN